LTIRYADGTVQELTAEPYQFYRETGDSATSFWQDGDIPVFKFDQWDFVNETEIQEGAEKLKGAAVAFLDLRSNVGGKSAMVANWLRTYSGISRIAGNGVSYNVYTGQADSRLPDGWLKHEDSDGKSNGVGFGTFDRHGVQSGKCFVDRRKHERRTGRRCQLYAAAQQQMLYRYELQSGLFDAG
jgi:hypothetical protein